MSALIAGETLIMPTNMKKKPRRSERAVKGNERIIVNYQKSQIESNSFFFLYYFSLIKPIHSIYFRFLPMNNTYNCLLLLKIV